MGKGVTSAIIPDKDMPIVNGKRIEMVLNPYALVSRKIPGQIMEIFMSNIALKLHSDVESMRNGRMYEIMPLINRYYGNRFKNMDVHEFLKLHDEKGVELYSFDVGSFSKYNPELIQEWGKELNVTTMGEVMMPEKDLVDLDALKDALPEEEYNDYVKSLEGKYRKVEKPLMSGSMYMMKLLHCPEYSNKVTTSMDDTKNMEPILGRGRYRADGQMIGDMELAVLQARGASEFINSSRLDKATITNQLFLNNLLGLGMTVVDDDGYRIGGSNSKDQMMRMKNKYKVK